MFVFWWWYLLTLNTRVFVSWKNRKYWYSCFVMCVLFCVGNFIIINMCFLLIIFWLLYFGGGIFCGVGFFVVINWFLKSSNVCGKSSAYLVVVLCFFGVFVLVCFFMIVFVLVFFVDFGVIMKFDCVCGDVFFMSAFVNWCTVGGDNEDVGKNEVNDVDFFFSFWVVMNFGDGNVLIFLFLFVVVDLKFALEFRFFACSFASFLNIVCLILFLLLFVFGDIVLSIVVSVEFNFVSGVVCFGVMGGCGDLFCCVLLFLFVCGGVVVDLDSVCILLVLNDIFCIVFLYMVKYLFVVCVVELLLDDMNDVMCSVMLIGVMLECVVGVDLVNCIDWWWRWCVSDVWGWWWWVCWCCLIICFWCCGDMWWRSGDVGRVTRGVRWLLWVLLCMWCCLLLMWGVRKVKWSVM